jgi:APA family basic amino acid/polyamine antiporter
MDQPGFARRLSLFDATMIVVSGIIGGGIFINPSVVARIVETPAMILLVWGIGGLIAVAGAFVFAELAAVTPKVGGQYAYFREAFHPLVAFLHGWSLLLIIQSGSTAAIAVACAQYAVKLGSFSEAIVPGLAAGITLAVAGFHSLGIKPGAVLINTITLGKTVALVVLIAAAFLIAPEPAAAPVPTAVPSGLGPLGLVSLIFAGLVPVMFAYGGWQNLNYLAEEVREPRRTLPRAILAGVFLVLVVYLSANIAYVKILSADGLAATNTPAADLAGRLFGEAGSRVISALIVISTFGFLNLAIMTAPRVYYAMAADGVFFRAVGRISARFHVPAAAILLQGVLAAALAAANSYERLLGYAVFADWVFFALAGGALLVQRARQPHAERPWKLPLYPLTPILFIAGAGGIVINTFVTDPKSALAGTAIMAAGVPIYFWWASRKLGRSINRPR